MSNRRSYGRNTDRYETALSGVALRSWRDAESGTGKQRVNAPASSADASG
jgi:hypothetical protein